MSTSIAEPTSSHSASPPKQLDWQIAIADTLMDGGVTVAAFVPDSRLDGVLTRLTERGLSMRSLTREEECVAYAAGQRIAGRKPVVLVQSSGVGNALNALSTLAVQYRLGLPLVISMRGTLGETNPSQVPIGRATASLLAALGIQTFPVRRTDDARPLTKGLLSMAFDAHESAAITLQPELGGHREGH